MSKIRRLAHRYSQFNIPWDLGKADYNLTEMVVNWPIMPCNTLELGCGTGDNSIWLAEHNFEVTAIDLIKITIDLASKKALKEGLDVQFCLADILKDKIPNAPFELVFDRGVFHNINDVNERKKFAKNVALHMQNGGLWLSLIGNADEIRISQGSPQRSASEIIDAVEPFFEILLLKVSYFDSKDEWPPQIWVCLMRKRDFFRRL